MKTKTTKKKEVLKTTRSKKKKGVLKNSTQKFSDTGIQGKSTKILRKDNTGTILLGLSLISLVLVMAVVGQFFVMESTDPSNVISNGTIISGINVGGMDSIDAEQLLYDVFSEKSKDFNLTITYGDKQWVYTKDDFKVNSEIHTIIEEAQKRNQILDDYDKQTQIVEEYVDNGVSVNVAFNYIFVGLDEKIEEIIKEVEYAPVNSEIKFDATQTNCFSISEHKNGLRVNKEELYYQINELFNKSNQIQVELPTVEVEPEITYEINKKQTELVASYTTYVDDSTGNRKTNVTKALNMFNGMVINPGEEVSFNSITGPHTESNGYKVATVIYNGRFVDGVGGGICQASTTLYNALLLADVKILEVHKHTLPVKYVPLGLDAMVSEHLADLRFVNDGEYPIYIQTRTDNKSVTAKVYGVKPEYEIKSSSQTIQTLKHTGDKVVLDNDKEYTDKVLFKGEQYRLSYPRDGYEAKAYLEYYINGNLVSKQEIRHEYYNPQNGIIIEGVEEVPNGMNAIENNVNINTSNMHNLDMNDPLPTSICP